VKEKSLKRGIPGPGCMDFREINIIPAKKAKIIIREDS
jgi:hypothetical protein